MAERSVYDATVAFFEDQERRVLAKLRSVSARKGTRHWDYGDTFDPELEKKALDPRRIFDPAKEADALAETVGGAVGEVFDEFGRQTSEALGTPWNLHDPFVTTDLLNRTNRIRGASETTWLAIQDALVEGERAGETIDGIAKRVGRVFDQARGYRARMIARTETVGAANAGSLAGARQSGVVGKKTWLATTDARTRASHVTADGQTVPIDEKFQVGASRMEAPGDPAGGAHETINCRCTLLFERTVEAAEPGAQAVVTVAGLADRVARARQITDPVQRRLERQKIGASIRESALAKVGDVDARRLALEAERDAAGKAASDAMDALFHTRRVDFDSLDEFYAARKVLDDAYEAANLRRDAVNVQLRDLRGERGRAALEVLRQAREFGTTSKAIKFEAGSSAAAKKAVAEAAEWYPAEWWALSNETAFQAKWIKGRASYGQVFDKKSGTLQSRLTTGEYAGNSASTTTHELGHRMEAVVPEIRREEMAFWRRRTQDGRDSRTYKYGRPDEVVSPDEFGDEYMGKDYFGAFRTTTADGRPVRRNVEKRAAGDHGYGFDAELLDALDATPGRIPSWEILSMAMEELRFDNKGSWENDSDLIDWVLGLLAVHG